jgi:hypothetical protein
VSERRFPVIKQETRAEMPRSVPWEFAERFRAQAEMNHGQTLERLAERGGLSPEEIWLAVHGKRLREIGQVTEQNAIAWLRAETNQRLHFPEGEQ